MKTTYIYQLLTICILLFISTNIFGQDCPPNGVSFQTQAEVDSFLILYPDCKEIQGGVGIGKNINNLEGLLGITHIHGILRLKENSLLTNFSGLDSLVHIGSGGTTYLAYVHEFWAGTEIEYIDITGYLNDVSLMLVNNSGLINLDGLQNVKSADGMLRILNNSALTDLDALENLKTIGSGKWSYTEYETSNSVYTENISVQINENPQLNSIAGLNSVTDMDGSFQLIKNFKLKGNYILESLKNIGTENHVYWWAGMPEPATDEYTTIIITKNYNLDDCASAGLCRVISNNDNIEIFNNGANCSDTNSILELCQYIGVIVHPVFYDINENGIFDIDEFLINGAKILIEPGSISSVTNQTTGGFINLAPNTYTLSLDTSNLENWSITSDSTNYAINIDSSYFRDTIYFGINPLIYLSEMNVISVPEGVRCNQFSTIDLIAENSGTTFLNGTMWIQIDPNIENINYINTPDTIIGDSLIGWHFTDLAPTNTMVKQIKLKMPGPDVFPIGDPIHFNSKVVFSDMNGVDSTSYQYSEILECAYDPNDKLVGPVYPENYALIGEELFYTIRFQNTGNAEAYNVVIKDILDENLDVQSFNLVNSSHPEVLSTTINDNKEITFDFHNIFLPDSTTNLEESQGQVTFSIKVLPDIMDFTIIENQAKIYFDFNPPISTNTTQNIMVHTFDADEDGYEIWKDCDDTNPDIYIIEEETPYDGIDNDCNPLTLDDDLDQDGFANIDDCDDNNPDINPDAEETAYDGIDNDCDSSTLDDDLDQDGFANVDDCDDNNPDINPDAEETAYDGIDNDCDSSTLDDDLDQDGFANVDDCDDNNPDINPDAEEIPNNGIDEDCDGSDLITSLTETWYHGIQIFPNPVQQELIILNSSEIKIESQIRIYDITGNLLHQTSLTDSTKILDLSNIDNGIYFIEISNIENGAQYIEKLIKAE